MLRKLTLMASLVAALICPLAAQSTGGKTVAAPAKKASALNKVEMEAYLRHLFVWPKPIEVVIEDPKAGPMPGFYEVKTRGVSGAQMQEETFFVSHDGQKIVRGTVFDIAQNPFKAENDKLRTEGRPSFGTPGAPVVIAEFSDFQCPYCREEAKTLRENLLKTYPKEVRLYYFDFPLEAIHPWAKPAALAGRCIFRQSASAWWEYHDWIFDKQAEIVPENLKAKVLEFAKPNKDLDAAQLSKCIDSNETEAELTKSREIGQSLGVNQTPTIFINGRRLAGASAWSDLKFVIDYEIEYQKTAKSAGEDCGCDLRLPGFAGGKQDEKPGLLKK